MGAKEPGDTVTIRGIKFGILRAPDGTIPYKVCGRPGEFGAPPIFEFEMVPCCMCWTTLVSALRDKKYAPAAKPICFDCVGKLAPSMLRAQ